MHPGKQCLSSLSKRCYPLTSNTGCTPRPTSSCDVLGQQAYDPTWGQWAGDVSTDGSGYGSVTIQIDPARVVNIPAAAVYSNTQFASISFSMSTTSSVENDVGVTVSIGGALAINAGFTSTVKDTSTNGVGVSQNNAGYLTLPYYLIDYYCAGSTSYQPSWGCSQGIVTSGPSAAVPGNSWSGVATAEYLNPTTLPKGTSFDCNQIISSATHIVGYTFSTGTKTTLGISPTFSFRGISVTLSFSTTVSSSTSDTTTVTFGGSIAPTTFTFRFYPVGGTCANPTFGSELHVWDMTGDFGMSTSPSSLSTNPGQSASTTATIASFNGFSEAVSLSSSAPSGISVSLSTNPVSPTVGGSATSTVAISVASAVGYNTYTVVITGSSRSGITHTTNITVTVQVPPGGGGGTSPCPLCPKPS